jgi:hypothetical protein
MNTKEILIMICSLVLMTFFWLNLSRRAFGRWKLVRVIRIPDSDVIRIRMNQVTPDGTILREATIRGSLETWWFEDEWGDPKTQCPEDISRIMKKVWVKEMNLTENE